MKKWFIALVITLAVVCLIPAAAMAASAPSISGASFFANGTPITIAAPGTNTSGRACLLGSDGPNFTNNVNNGVALIYWGTGASGGYVYSKAGISIFGGGGNALTGNTSIKMTGGSVGNIYGGGYNGAVTGNAEVVIEGGTVSMNVSGSGFDSRGAVSGTKTVSVQGATIIGNAPIIGGDPYDPKEYGILLNSLSGNKVSISGALTANANIGLVLNDATDDTVVAEADAEAYADALKFTASKDGTTYDLKAVGTQIKIGTPPVAIAFNDLTADGSATATTTKVTLTFSADITGLSASDITLTAGSTGATKGALTSTGTGTYELALTGITTSGDITVAVAKTGNNITPASKTVAVSYYTPPVNASVTPTTATYDKRTATAGLDFTLTPGSYTLSAIQSSGATLTSGTDYTVSGNVYTIAQSFLDAQTVGTVTLTFDMDGGTDPTVAITISDSAPAPSIIFSTQPAADTTVTVGSISGSLTVVATASTGQVVTLNWYECNENGVISGGSLGSGGTFEIPTSLWVGEYYYLCQATLAGAADVNSEVAKVTVNIIYDITDGADGVWEQGGTNGLGFTASGSYEIFQNEVTVDGNQLNTDDFDSHHGSTIITLKPAYLNTLALGVHTLRVVFRDGYAQTNFTITSAGGPTVGPTAGPTTGPTAGPTAGPTSKPTKPPKTGDNSAPVIWLSLCLLCGTGLVLFSRRRRGA